MNQPLAQTNTAAILVAVFVSCGLALRIIFWTGPTGSDDVRYFEFAAKFLTFRSFSEVDIAVRLGFLGVIGVPAVLFDCMSAGIAMNVLLSLVNDLITIWIAYRNFGKYSAVAAAFVMAFCGINILFPSTFLPDTLLTTLFLTVINLRWLLIAGLVTGAAYSVKDNGILLLPPVALFVFLKARQQRAARSLPLACYMVGILGTVLIENTVYFAYTGHFFYRQIAMAKMNDALFGEAPLVADFVRATADHFMRFGTRHVVYGTVAMLAAVPAWVLAVHRKGTEMLIALIGGFSLVYLLAGTQSFTRLVELPFQPRYFQPVVPFASLALATGYSRAVMNGRGARLVAYGVVALFVAVPSILAAPLISGNLYRSAYFRNVATVVPLLNSSGRPIFLESQEFNALRHFLAVNTYSNLRPSQEGPGASGYYIINPDRIPESRLAEMLGGHRVFEFQLDTRTYRRYFPTVELPDFNRLGRQRVVVLEVKS
jgi:hypothetical protein